MARRLDESPAVERVQRESVPKMMQMEPGPEPPDPRPREVPEETPVIPPNEPQPAPVQDPPAEPNTSPYVVRGQAASRARVDHE
jgi:hypothetical protein